MKSLLYPLTHPQKRIFNIEKIFPESSLHNIGGTVHIKGNVDFDILEKSIQAFIKKNDAIRIRLIENDGEMHQQIFTELKKIDYYDFSVYEDPESEFQNWVKRKAKSLFPLEDQPLYYFAMFKLTEKETGYLVKFHHIIADGWSINVMTEQICQFYVAISNQEVVNDEVEYSYLDFIECEKKYVESSRFEKNKEFWRDKLQNLPDVFLSKSSDDLTGNRETFQLEETFANQIQQFVREQNISMNAFFVSVYAVFLHKTLQQEDILIGTPVLNRSGKKEKSMVGMFTSSMPFRTLVKASYSFEELLQRIKGEITSCFFHQKYPYDLLALDMRKCGYNDLFKICVNYYNTKHPSRMNGMVVENREFYNGAQLYSLQMVIKEWDESGKITLEFDYKVNDYTQSEIRQMFNSLKHLMQQLIAKPKEALQNISILTKEEYWELIYGFNNTKTNYPQKSLHELFEEQVGNGPNKIAVRFEQQVITYQELNQKANQAARFLQSIGVSRGSIVGVMVIPSIEMITVILAILKTGAAYLPIDVNYPLDRINFMLENAKPSLLLSNVKDKSISFSGEIFYLDDERLFTGESSNLDVISEPDDIAYVIYTSGSTGKPKGTMIHHRGVVNYLWWAKNKYINNENEVFPLYSSLSFDLTVTSLFTPLISGHQIIVYQEDESEFVLFKILRENQVTILKLTPAHLNLIAKVDNKASSIKRLIVGGEDLKVHLAKNIHESFGGNIEIFNEYGPTETVVGCIVHKYDHVKDIKVSVPIGQAADNVQLYVLDQNLDPLPKKAIGELYISGDGVAKGYLNNPELTKERFINNPFIPGTVMYKTGDLVRWSDYENMEYIGRSDHQVKLRGYRVELGEIEHHLLKIDGVENAVVVLLGENEQQYLCAYLETNKVISESEIKSNLIQALPDYMIPIFFVQLEQIPLDQNGKVNRKQLPSPMINNHTVERKAVKTEKEALLIRIMEEVLQKDSIQTRDNFYQLGGDSIKAIQIVSKLKDAGYRIQVKDILANPIIEYLALMLQQGGKNVASNKICEGVVQQLPITKWFFTQGFSNDNHFNQSVLLKLKTPVMVEQLEIIFPYLIKHHDSLRLNYDRERGTLFYQNSLVNAPFYIHSYDLRSFEDKKWEQLERMGEKLKASFDITRDILIKAALFTMGDNEKYLLITAHHLVVDGISWRILLEDIGNLLEQIQQNIPLSLPKKTASYQEWGEALNEWGKKHNTKEQDYWNKIGEIAFQLPIESHSGETNIQETVSFSLSLEETELFLSKANLAYNTDPHSLLVISLGMAIRDYFKKREIIIVLEGHGREEIVEDIDLSRTVGWFTSMYPVCLHCEETNELPDLIKQWKESLKSVSNKGIGYGLTRYSSDHSSFKKEITQVRFNFLGDFDNVFTNRHFEWCNTPTGPDSSLGNHMTAVLDIVALVINRKLQVTLSYRKQQKGSSNIRDFSNVYSQKLIEMINHCCQMNEVCYTPSDFETVSLSQGELDKLFL
ncbi:non-ribosomal peptide synthetase [Brevibacillus laterosporus]|uniref:Carrier domain-containing protein n=1 Tax=Brevibacillus laterosporus TaxID=1465 RepID=A0A0F7C1H7_BRELA|nr:non-ribosomal peptide synthetase [Brevibacillus laterosporus]AKF95952.1 hypothetical protein EX87_20455 [Brevibacillus laterosporus]